MNTNDPEFSPSRPSKFSRFASIVLAAGLLSAPCLAQGTAHSNILAVDGDHFTLDGKPFQVLSGEIHYARIPRADWRARMQMAKAMGLNTIATYVFWNVHEPSPGTYDFTGNNDLAAFIRMAQEEHLHVLLRAGPYACAEWEFGGFPAWLLKNPADGVAIRADDPRFMVPSERWIKRLATEVKPLLAQNGGPVIAVQVENEYGNFGSDKKYMEHMLQIFQQSDFAGTLFYTVDPSKALAKGDLPGILAGVNFGTGHAEDGAKALAALRPGAPLFASEYWPGWFDLWGHPHETRPIAPQLADIEYVLSHHGSINIYMFHGGTSFGMMAGASASTGNYRGNVTSYDYDAPLDEAGHPTSKFLAYRDLILKYTGETAPPVPPVTPVISIPEFKLYTMTPLLAHLPKPIEAATPLTMEQVGQAYGYILYRTQLPAAISNQPLVLDAVHDFALVYLDGALVGTLDRHYNQSTLKLSTTKPAQLDILVENTGRLNSTKHMRTEWKGIQSATLGGKPLTGWQIYPLPMQDAGTIHSGVLDTLLTAPHFAFGGFNLTQTGDTFLDVTALGKGVLWINGHCLGRFWNIGPQQTLYVPASWLKKGRNDVVAFDVFAATSFPKLVGRSKPILDGPTPGYATDPERNKKAAPDAEFGPKLPATTPSSNP